MIFIRLLAAAPVLVIFGIILWESIRLQASGFRNLGVDGKKIFWEIGISLLGSTVGIFGILYVGYWIIFGG